MHTARAPRPDRHSTATTVVALFAVATGTAAALTLHLALRLISPDHTEQSTLALGLAVGLAAIVLAINAFVLLILAVMSPVTGQKNHEKSPGGERPTGRPPHRQVPVRRTPTGPVKTGCRIIRSGRVCR